MPGFLLILLARIGVGERLAPAKPEDYRAWSGFFFLFPCYWTVFASLTYPFFQHAGGIAIWLVGILAALVFLVVQTVWAHLVPTGISLVLGYTSWISLLWLAWHGKF